MTERRRKIEGSDLGLYRMVVWDGGRASSHRSHRCLVIDRGIPSNRQGLGRRLIWCYTLDCRSVVNTARFLRLMDWFCDCDCGGLIVTIYVLRCHFRAHHSASAAPVSTFLQHLRKMPQLFQESMALVTVADYCERRSTCRPDDGARDNDELPRRIDSSAVG